MESLEHTEGTTSPALTFAETCDTITSKLGGLYDEKRALISYVNATDQAIEQTRLGYDDARNSFFESLSLANPIYRAVFEIQLAQSDVFKDPTSSYSHDKLISVDTAAQRLMEFNAFLTEQTNPLSAMQLSLKKCSLSQNTKNLSYPSASDLTQSQALTIDAQLMRIEPNSQLSVHIPVRYDLPTGLTSLADSVSMGGSQATDIRSDIRSFDHDSWLDKPSVYEYDSYTALLLAARSEGISAIQYPGGTIKLSESGASILYVGDEAIRSAITSTMESPNIDHRTAHLLSVTYLQNYV